MPHVVAGFDRPINWMKVASHLLAAKYVVTRRRAGALAKFDGERDNGRVFTVLVDGRGGRDGFREDSDDLEGAVSRAFPGGDDVLKPGTAELAGMLKTLHAWASQGLVAVITVTWLDHSLDYMASVSGSGDRFARVRGANLVDVTARCIGDFEALTSRSE